MGLTRPFPWEASYPEGVRWDAPVLRATLPELLATAAEKFGDGPAIEFRERQISFNELARRAGLAAAGFHRLGLVRGDTVAFYLHNTPYHPIAFFGAFQAGLRVVLLSPLDAPRVLAHKLQDSRARTLLTSNIPGMLQVAERLLAEGHADRLIVGEDAAWGTPSPGLPVPAAAIAWTDFEGGPAPPDHGLTPDDVACLQYTGGTTGLPRAAMLTHGNLTAAISMLDNWGASTSAPFSIGIGDRVLGVLPLFHIYALTGVLLRSISAGAEIMLRPRFDVATTLADIEQKRATVFPGVPTMWIALAGLPDLETRDFSSLKFAGSGGAPLPAEIAVRIEAATGCRLGGGWGMTETSPIGALIPTDVTYKPGLIGLPVPGLVMRIVSLDDPAVALGPNERGEIAIRGPNVTPGYYGRPEENAKAFADGWFLTGDVGHMDERGFFFLVDRKKDMIISGGFNVYPAMIEDAVYEHPDVAECAVIGIADPYRGQAAKVFVSLKPGAVSLSYEALKVFLTDRVGRHEMPVALEIRESLPKTPVGKLSRKELSDEETAKAG
ncbi:MAG: AMP-binding protein [Alphaproteobacteria bacterium]|nr:AMP-binding protein [Alphaproteobacteria bacterium]